MTRSLPALVGALALVVAGCGGEEPEPATEAETPVVEETTPETTDTAAAPTQTATGGATGTAAGTAGAATVSVTTTDLGDVLADQEGMVLYMFVPDEQGESTCYDQCAQAWPPLVTSGDPMAGEGADQTLLGVVEREDGSQQVTYNDWPLYYWAQDEAPGDTTGQGVNDVWWVLDPAGEPIRE